MKRFIVCLLCLALTLPFACAEEDKVLNLFTWEGYVDSQTIADFEAATGVRINFSTFDADETMLLKLQNAGGGDYDVIIAADYILNIARKEGLLAKLDKTLIPNYANIDPAYLSQYFDENNEYTAPYIAGTPLIVYNPDLVDIEITGYESLWDPSLRDSLVILDEPRNMIGITLKTLGQSFNVTDDEILNQAKEKLMLLRPNVRSFNSTTPDVDLISGECAVGYMYTSYVLSALIGNPDLKVAYPKEGMGFGIDCMVVPVNAPHKQNAHAFINFILDGIIGAQVAQAQLFISPNAAAYEFLPDDYKNNPALFIPPEVLGTPEFIMDVGEYESVYSDIWTQFKLAK